MKTKQINKILLVAILTLLNSLTASAQVVNIPDPSLRAAIRQALNKPIGDITVGDMESLTELDASLTARGFPGAPFRPLIESLEGLESARNLRLLVLSGNWGLGDSLYPNIAISDWSPVAGLTNLKTLDLDVNGLATLTLPDGFEALTTLSLHGNNLTNLILPNGLTNLTTLDLNSRTLYAANQLTDLSFLNGLSGLTALDLSWNGGLSDVTLPTGLSSLRELHLDRNDLASLTLPAGMNNLQTLDLEGNSLSRLILMGDFRDLTTLDVSQNELTDFSFLESLVSLTTLDLDYSPQIAPSLLSELTSLTSLSLYADQLTDFSLLDGLTNLTTLYLHANQLTNDFYFLSGLPGLTTLGLTSNNPMSFTLPDSVTGLTALDLQGAWLTNLTLPRNLTNLTTLDLSRNPLKSLSVPEGLSNLGTLDLQRCQLLSLTLPEGLTNLTTLNLGENLLTNFSFLSGLSSLRTLDLRFSSLTSLTLPAGLTNLTELNLKENQLTSLTLPEGLSSLTTIDVQYQQLTNLTLPADMTSLTTLDLEANQLTSLVVPAGLSSLTTLDLGFNQLTNLSLPEGLTNLSRINLTRNQLTDFSFLSGLPNLTTLRLSFNQLTNLSLPEGLTNLATLELNGNQLTDFSFLSELTGLRTLDLLWCQMGELILPEELSNLITLRLRGNQLTNVSFLEGLTGLRTLDLSDNHLTSLTLPERITGLTTLDLHENQLKSLTLPAGLSSLTALDLRDNPLTRLVLPEPAAQNVNPSISELRAQGVDVVFYPLESPTTHYVWQESPNPTPPYSNWATAAHVIQDAVDAAVDGDTVLVTNGVYSTGGRAVHGSETNRVAIDRRITTRSVNGPTVTVILGAEALGGGNGEGAIRCVHLTDGASLSGFTLTNGATPSSGGGVWCGSESPAAVISNCVVSGNSAASGGGGVLGGTLYNCILTGNSSSDWGGGAAESALFNCTVTGNRAPRGRGGGVWNSSLYNCIVYYNEAFHAANHYEPRAVEYSCTTPLPLEGVGNIDQDPILASATRLAAQSPCIGAGNPDYAFGVDIDGELWMDPPSMGAAEVTLAAAVGDLNMSVQADHHQVSAGFPVALVVESHGTIRTSVWNFGDGTVVSNRAFTRHTWTAPGSYTVSLTGFNSSSPGGVTTSVQIEVIESVFYVDAANPSPALPYNSWETAATTVQDAIDAGRVSGRLVLVTNGVYATGGKATHGMMTNRVALVGPVVVRSVNGPEVTIIEGAEAPEGGNGDGAIRCAYVGTNAILSGFTLTNGHTRVAPFTDSTQNSGGGAWADASGVLTNCILIGNSADFAGGGAYWAVLQNCLLAANSATGADASGGGAGASILYNCVLTSNSANGTSFNGGGGGAHRCVLYNCVLTGNSAREWGGGAAGGELFNCTITGNSAPRGAGVFGGMNQGLSQKTRLHNCIVYHNEGQDYLDFSFVGQRGVEFYSSCTSPLPVVGYGNISSDPGFLDAAAGDFRLAYDSPCIDAGSDLSGLITIDLDGRSRPLDGDGDGIAAFDMGAYEFVWLRILAFVGDDGLIRMQLQGSDMESVIIQRSTDMVTWEDWQTMTLEGSRCELIDNTLISPQLFYRAVEIR